MEKGKVNVVLSLIDKDIEYHPMSLAAHLLDSGIAQILGDAGMSLFDNLLDEIDATGSQGLIVMKEANPNIFRMQNGNLSFQNLLQKAGFEIKAVFDDEGKDIWGDIKGGSLRKRDKEGKLI